MHVISMEYQYRTARVRWEEREQHTSQWLGSPDECPKTHFSAISSPVKVLIVEYDISTSQVPCPFSFAYVDS